MSLKKTRPRENGRALMCCVSYESRKRRNKKVVKGLRTFDKNYHVSLKDEEGPPGSPGGVRLINKTDKSVTLQWSRGADNHSPISKYTVQYRDSLSKDVWKNATTSPADVEGNAETATVVDLVPWTEYEFRVIATNTLGTGEPSSPSPKDRTLEAVPVVAPSDVGGGGGTSRELTITWTPVQPQYYYGPNFGYIVAFKPQDKFEWKRVIVSNPQANRYVHKESSIRPSTEFEVKVKAFNSEGEGPYSLTAIIYSAQDGKHSQLLLNTEARVWECAKLISEQCHRSTRPLSTASQATGNPSICRHSVISKLLLKGMSLKWFSCCAVTYLSQCVLCLPSAPSEAPVSVDGKALSATEAIVWWLPLLQSNIDGYQVKFWRNQEDGEGGAQRVVVPGKENHTRLEGMKPDSHYLIEVRGYNSAGYGPPSEHLRIHTKKPPPSRPPKIISKKLKGQSVNIAWEHVEPLANEASIDGYKVLYRQQGHSTGILYTTSRRYIDLPLHTDGNYVVEVRAHSEGGDGAVARIHITGGGVMTAQSLSVLSLLLVALLCLNL
ncbi:hypothetical protein INR49_024995 [Caranx melampygus]|nr:hypothetical protein INR49_024995 [Caranx melampygus]